jgi:glycerol-3-phosphate O-acyltransferase
VRRALEALAENGVVSRFAEGAEVVYRIGPEQELAAAYYRNTVIHFFVNAAIAELALLAAAEGEPAAAPAAFWRAAMELRDVLKFDFFFAEKEIFRGELRQELALQNPDWEGELRRGPDAIRALVRGFRPFSSHRTLRPFFDSYRLVADQLEREPPDAALDESACVARCMGLGRQYHLQRRIQSASSISQPLLRSALRLAGNRGLLEPGAQDLAVRRRAFAEEIRAVLRRIDAVDALAASRRAGLIP